MSRKRHTIIQVPESWLQSVDEWRHREKLSQKQVGELAGQAIGEEAFAPSTISRFMGGSATRELVIAVSKASGIAMPSEIDELTEDEAVALDALRRLQAADRQWFLWELRTLEDIADLAEQRGRQRGRKKNS